MSRDRYPTSDKRYDLSGKSAQTPNFRRRRLIAGGAVLAVGAVIIYPTVIKPAIDRNNSTNAVVNTYPFCEIPLDSFNGSVSNAEKAAKPHIVEAQVHDDNGVVYHGPDTMIPAGDTLEMAHINPDLCVQIGGLTSSRSVLISK